jgi:hypothetical protein
MTKDEGFALLADMRRKYLHAREAENGIREGDWRKGEPITAAILERWIPQIEALVNALPDEPNGDDPWVMDVAGVSVELKEWEPGAVRRPAVKGAAPPLPEPRRMHDDRQREVCVFWPEEWERIRAALNRGAEP